MISLAVRSPRKPLVERGEPSGRIEDFHGVHLLYRATVADGEPRVVEEDGTTDAVAWVDRRDVASGKVPVLDLVRHAIERGSP